MNKLVNTLAGKYPDKDFHEDRFGRIAFVHQGIDITDPMSSECSRFEIDPMYYGIKMFDAVAMCSFNAVFDISIEDETAIDPDEVRGGDYGND